MVGDWGSADMSRTLNLSSRLISCAWDPVADGSGLHGVEQVGSVEQAVAGADAAVIVTEWPELITLARAEVREAMARPLIVDGRNMLDPSAVRAAGFEYEGIGRPAAAVPAER